MLNSSVPRQKREDSMEMSLNLEVYVHRASEKDLSSSNTSLCDATCHMLLTFKLLQMFKDNIQVVILTPVTTVAGISGHTTFIPVDTSVGIKYIFGCIGGYYLNKGFCSACPKNTFSEVGATECSPCPAHTYQGALGARKCIPCTHAWAPACSEYFEEYTNYVIIALVVFLVSILLAGFIFWYLLFVRKKNFTAMARKLIPKAAGTKRKVKTGKSQKRVRKHDIPLVKVSRSSVVTVEELQELMDSSPGWRAGECPVGVLRLRQPVVCLQRSAMVDFSSSRPLLVALLALALSARTGDAIRCYVCSSERDPSCKDDFLPSHQQHKLTFCSQENMRDISDLIPGIFSNFGYRSTQPEDFQCVKAKRREYGREVVVRSCTIPRADTFDVCSQLKSRDLEFCQPCHTDACNGAPPPGSFLYLLLAAPALLTLRAYSAAA